MTGSHDVVDAVDTTPAALRRAARLWGGREAIADVQPGSERRLTWSELAAEVERFAAGLVRRGVGPGDRVALWAPNTWQWVVAALGVQYAGGVVVPVNTRYTGVETLELLQRTRAVAVVVAGEFLGAEVVEEERINCHHNYTEKEEHFGRTVWLTRKGAIRADEDSLALIPGSMGTASYVVEGKGNAVALRSAPHGAGRRFSRSEARRRFTVEDLDQRMVGIVYRHGDAWVDEIPDAYKDIDAVMADSAELVHIRHTLRQVLNIKGT